MKPLLLALLIAFAAPLALAQRAQEFAPGQVWSIKSATPTTARVIIGRVEPWLEGRTVIHIAIIDIPPPPGASGVRDPMSIGHMPFDKAALTASVDRLLATGASPGAGFEGGYQQWKNANGGIFTVSVERAVQLMWQTINQNRRQ